jgi:regulator of sirC expression with transglutaminase-like and TPR domain
VSALNALIFGSEGYRRVIDRKQIEAMLLPRVLADRRGSCLGLGGLYLALGETAGLTLAGVLVPGHFFVRQLDGHRTRDIELLKRGRQMPPSWYRRKYRVPESSNLYLRTLTPEESLEVLRFNLATPLRERGELASAAGHYRQVVARLPAFAEAQANLGLTYQLMGQRKRAEAAYEAAREANPRIEGLDENLRRLHEPVKR